MAMHIRGGDGDALGLPIGETAMDDQPVGMLEYAAEIRRLIQNTAMFDGVSLHVGDDGDVRLFATTRNGDVLALPVDLH